MTIIWSRTNSKNAVASIGAVERALAEAQRQQQSAVEDLLGDPYLAEQVAALRRDWPVDTTTTLAGGSGFVGRLVGTGRGLARRATWWYQLPQWQQVNHFHGVSVRVIDSLVAGMAQLRQRILLLEEQSVKIKSLEEQLGIAYERQRHLLEEVNRLRSDLEALKAQQGRD